MIRDSGFKLFIDSIRLVRCSTNFIDLPLMTPENQDSARYTEHDDVNTWKRFLCYWPFMRGIHRSLVGSIGLHQQRACSTDFDVFFDIDSHNKRMNKHSICRWFVTPWRAPIDVNQELISPCVNEMETSEQKRLTSGTFGKKNKEIKKANE